MNASQKRGSYTEEAVAHIERQQRTCEGAAPQAARVLSIALDWLRSAQCVRLGIPLVPSGDEERFVATHDSHGAGLVPTSDVVAIEYEHAGMYDAAADLTRCLATRRIALCVNLESESAVRLTPGQLRSPGDAGALLVWPITWFDEKGEWEPAAGAAVIPRRQLSGPDVLAGRIRPRFWRALRTRYQSERTPLSVKYQVLLPELAARLGDELDRSLRETALDAVWAALGYFAATQCANVVVQSDHDGGQSAFVRRGPTMVPLDPFHGTFGFDWRGRPSWTQQVGG